MDDPSPAAPVASKKSGVPWLALLAIWWPVGTVFLYCLAWGTVYNGMFDPPLPPETPTRVLMSAMLARSFIVPAVGLPFSLKRRNPWLVAVFVVELALGTGCGYVYGFGTYFWG